MGRAQNDWTWSHPNSSWLGPKSTGSISWVGLN